MFMPTLVVILVLILLVDVVSTVIETRKPYDGRTREYFEGTSEQAVAKRRRQLVWAGLSEIVIGGIFVAIALSELVAANEHDIWFLLLGLGFLGLGGVKFWRTFTVTSGRLGGAR